MRRTLSAAAFLALMVPTMGRADDADSEKQVASLSKQNYAALVAGDTSALDAILSDDWLVIDPFGEVISKARQAKELKDGTTDFVSILGRLFRSNGTRRRRMFKRTTPVCCVRPLGAAVRQPTRH